MHHQGCNPDFKIEGGKITFCIADPTKSHHFVNALEKRQRHMLVFIMQFHGIIILKREKTIRYPNIVDLIHDLTCIYRIINSEEYTYNKYQVSHIVTVKQKYKE